MRELYTCDWGHKPIAFNGASSGDCPLCHALYKIRELQQEAIALRVRIILGPQRPQLLAVNP